MPVSPARNSDSTRPLPNTTQSPGVLARVVLVRDATAPAEILYGHVSTGTLLSDRATCYDGWNQIGLYEVSHAAVESCLTQGYIDMGIQSGSTRCSGEAYGYTGPTDLKAFLLVTFTTETQFCDLCALDARLASFPSRTSEQETVRLTALHPGDIQPESVMAYLDLNGALSTPSTCENWAMVIRSWLPSRFGRPRRSRRRGCHVSPHWLWTRSETTTPRVSTAGFSPHTRRGQSTLNPTIAPLSPLRGGPRSTEATPFAGC